MLKELVNSIRRNHALEHATIAVMLDRQGPMRVIGRASPDGFYVYGNVTTERLAEYATEALAHRKGVFLIERRLFSNLKIAKCQRDSKAQRRVFVAI